ncbi:MAG: mechanosensitive ion channel family protein [Mycobacteriales bacterium]|nr:MAG: mechanosensitive ion channel protein MscS [Pseudonocardiales bacterium]
MIVASKPACADRPDTFCNTVWRVTHTGWVASIADTILGPIAKIVLVVIVALIVRWLLHRLIRRLVQTSAQGAVPAILAPLTERAASSRLVAATGWIAERRRQRAETIGSILRSIASFVVTAVAFMLILGELGIDLAPILTSAGIVGVALGFGAQNLVKDFLAGMFMILEDQFGVGDVVDAGHATGRVEAVGLRTSRLRDSHGTVWYVRNGEVLRLGNKSQGALRMELDVAGPPGISRDLLTTDVRQVAGDLRRADGWADSFLDEPSVTTLVRGDTVLARVRALVRRDDREQVAREVRTRVEAFYDAETESEPNPIIGGSVPELE